ncbi:hypothetical protein MMC07_008170 [Pseudocyphellaria aurata]|nr:hypothetical protein [Pseudocyphellaria aurata]
MQGVHSVGSVNETDSERFVNLQTIPASRAIKPLPPLPRGWSRVCHETGLFLRGIGLGIVVTTFQGIFTKDFSEPEKVAIRRSRTTALLRALIHIVPLGVSIFEIVLNFKGRFVGETFNYQNYIQFAAKGHEIAMQASIATILLSYIRYQISAGKGMPFGAVLSGLQFLQVSYLWSVELWSSILSKEFRLRKKLCFAVLILVCIAVAATAGPSSANLLIARQGLWPTASTYLAVNASFQDIWPDRLDDTNLKNDCATVTPDSPDEWLRCPMSYLASFDQHHVESLLESNSLADEERLIDFWYSSPGDFSLNYLSSKCATSQATQGRFCATIPQATLSYGYYYIQYNHFEETDFAGYQSLRKNYYQPYTVASCVTDVVKDASDQTPLRFARISEESSQLEEDREIFPIPGLTTGQIIDKVSSDNSEFRVDWIDLPMDTFNTGVPGAVIVSQDLNGSFYNITTCTLNAGWGSSELQSTSLDYVSIFSHPSNIPPFWTPGFANFSDSSYPQRRVSISKSWMEFLNPTIKQANNSTDTLISRLLSSEAQLINTPHSTEFAVAQMLIFLLAIAMTSTGSGQHNWEVFNDLNNATTTCDTCLVFEVEYSYIGWFYSTHGTTTRLALTIMLAYCILVFGHIVYSAISGVSSTAWDSAAEIVALAMNSSPTDTLQNTCAGIVGRKAFKTSVKVLATTPGHLELVFGDFKGPNAQNSQLIMNEKYGKLAEAEAKEYDDEEPKSVGYQIYKEHLEEKPLLRARRKGETSDED